MKCLLLGLGLLFLSGSWAKPTHERKCGYAGCPSTSSHKLNVHLVPHTHDDVGWLKTPDQYYYGSRNYIQFAGVQYILDSVIDALLKNPERRFVYVESEFFFKWWDEQTPETQGDVRMLVNEGRLEFIGGAWSMNDEASTHYQSIIDQFSLGLQRLTSTFGACGRPRVGWQIDPFGHSREMASLFAQMGYDGEFFARLDWVERNNRFLNKTGEMIWHGSDNLGESSDLFTGVLFNHYSSPPGFCFDIVCNDDPIIDGDSYDKNVDKKVADFVQYIKSMSKYYRSNHLIVPMGDDFQYQDASVNFKNIDKLIKYVNAKSDDVQLFYSTPSCYLKSIHDAKLTWPSKTSDFFPYSSDKDSYWTGYFTSRPSVKRFERDGNHFLQVCKQLTVLAKLDTESARSKLDNLRNVMGIMQHHDAITGTEKQAVAFDYDETLYDAVVGCMSNTKKALRALTGLKKAEFQSCLSSNISACEATESSPNFVVTLYNPLSLPVEQFVRLPVHEGNYVVKNEKGETVPTQMVAIPAEVLALPFRFSVARFELVFEANVDKLTTFSISRVPDSVKAKDVDLDINIHIPTRPTKPTMPTKPTKPTVPTKTTVPTKPTKPENPEDGGKEDKPENLPPIEDVADTVVENENIKLVFSPNGFLKSVSQKSNIFINNFTTNLKQEFLYYVGADGSSNRASGAYIFRPVKSAVPVTKYVAVKVFEGPLVKEVHQVFNDWISQVIRIYKDKPFVEFEWLVGPIPVEDNIGKEVITRYTSDIASNGVFYTDSNGRESIERVRNKRADFKPDLSEAISANYYPVTSKIALKDAKTRMAVLTDRAEGGTSMVDGELELMVHRRLLHDDGFGVGEALNEQAFGKGLVVRGKHYLMLGAATASSQYFERKQELESLLPLWKFISSKSAKSNEIVAALPDLSYLPDSVHVLTMEPWASNEVLLRFEHLLEKNVGVPQTFSLKQIVEGLGGIEIREASLDGNQWLSEMQRLKFSLDGGFGSGEVSGPVHAPFFAARGSTDNQFQVTLNPMQIRTFIVKLKKA